MKTHTYAHKEVTNQGLEYKFLVAKQIFFDLCIEEEDCKYTKPFEAKMCKSNFFPNSRCFHFIVFYFH